MLSSVEVWATQSLHSSVPSAEAWQKAKKIRNEKGVWKRAGGSETHRVGDGRGGWSNVCSKEKLYGEVIPLHGFSLDSLFSLSLSLSLRFLSFS